MSEAPTAPSRGEGRGPGRRLARRLAVYAAVAALAALAACAGILGLRRAAPDAFPHRAHVVAGVSCTRCHAGLEAPGSGLHLPADATCTDGCHAKPHDARPCGGCHTSARAAAELIEARDHLRFDHRRHTAAAKGNCMHCHDGVASGAARLRPPMATCFRCHGEARDARTCSACHRDLEQEGALPASHLAHEGDWLREHGARAASSGDLCESCHRESFCAGCHGRTAPAVGAAMRFADPARASVHRAGFGARHSLEARSDPGACTTCHAPDRCAACHEARGVAGGAGGPGRNPHPAGWLGLDNRHGREARRDPASCAGCHGGAGEQLCVKCHAVGGIGGSPHPPGWSSRQPLTAMPCRMCHPLGTAR